MDENKLKNMKAEDIFEATHEAKRKAMKMLEPEEKKRRAKIQQTKTLAPWDWEFWILDFSSPRDLGQTPCEPQSPPPARRLNRT